LSKLSNEEEENHKEASVIKKGVQEQSLKLNQIEEIPPQEEEIAFNENQEKENQESQDGINTNLIILWIIY